jgi:hypothetical protein
LIYVVAQNEYRFLERRLAALLLCGGIGTFEI